MGLKSKIQALIDYANETTEAGDTLLGDAVKTLCDGYQGGGSSGTSFPTLTGDSLPAKLSALLAYANGVTGAGDTRLGDAIRTLCEGYGGGETYTALSQNAGGYLLTDYHPRITTRIELQMSFGAKSGKTVGNIVSISAEGPNRSIFEMNFGSGATQILKSLFFWPQYAYNKSPTKTLTQDMANGGPFNLVMGHGNGTIIYGIDSNMVDMGVPKDYDCDGFIYLLGKSASNCFNQATSCLIHGCQIYEGDVLYADLVPAVVNGTATLVDKLGHITCTPQGGGFTAV